MRRLTLTVFLLLLMLCELSALAQRGGGYRPPPTYRPPVRTTGGGYGPTTTRPTVTLPNRPPRALDPARRPQIPQNRPAPGATGNRPATTTRSNSGSSGSSKPVVIPAPKSPTVLSAKTEAKPKLDQLRTSLKARLRSSSVLNQSGASPSNTTLTGSGYSSPSKDASKNPEIKLPDTFRIGPQNALKLAKDANIPSAFKWRTTRESNGVIFQHPTNEHESIRYMPGNPKSKFRSQWNPYVVHMRNGKALDINGNPVDRKTEEAHIPAEKYRYRP